LAHPEDLEAGGDAIQVAEREEGLLSHLAAAVPHVPAPVREHLRLGQHLLHGGVGARDAEQVGEGRSVKAVLLAGAAGGHGARLGNNRRESGQPWTTPF